MSRRIEIELTSARADGSWTWRAAGAREPKGVLDGSVLYADAKVGDVIRAEADFDIDGITVLSVMAPKGARKAPERIEVLGSGKAFEPITQTLSGKPGRSDRADRGDRPDRGGPRGPRPGGPREGAPRPSDGRPGGPRSDRPGAGRPAATRDGQPRDGQPRDGQPRDGQAPGGQPRTDRRPRPQGDAPRTERPRRERPPVAEVPSKPKPKRLRAVKTHRNALLATLPDEHRVIAEQVLRGGVPAVRAAVQEQNAQLVAAGQSAINPTGVVALAEELLPRVRVAEWLDRAEGASNDLDELDLRDLRSVVVAASDPMVSRDETTRELADRLKEGLNRRQEQEHTEWLGEITEALNIGRSVRALRLSSRPPKAGMRFPAELGARLADATSASMTPEASTERWVSVLDALAVSPVRAQVKPRGIPATVADDLKAAIARSASALPDVARLFGIEPPAPGSRAARAPRPGARKPIPKPPSPSENAAPSGAGASSTPVPATSVPATPTVAAATAPSEVIEPAVPVAELLAASEVTAEESPATSSTDTASPAVTSAPDEAAPAAEASTPTDITTTDTVSAVAVAVDVAEATVAAAEHPAVAAEPAHVAEATLAAAEDAVMGEV